MLRMIICIIIYTLIPIKLKFFYSLFSIAEPVESHVPGLRSFLFYIGLDRFCFILAVTKLMAVELSVLIGVGGCGCPIPMSVFRRGMASLAL